MNSRKYITKKLKKLRTKYTSWKKKHIILIARNYWKIYSRCRRT